MSNKSVSSLLLVASLFSGLVLTGIERAALAEPLRTSRPTQSQVRPGLSPASSTDRITPSEPENETQMRPGLNPAGSPQMQTQLGDGTTPVAWPPGPPCDSDILPPGHWGAPCVIRAVGDDPFN